MSFLPNKLPLFFIGIVSSYLYIELKLERISYKTFIALLGFLAVMSSADIFIAVAVMIWVFSLLLITLEYFPRKQNIVLKLFRWLLFNKAATWFGNLSYSFYCLHMISIYICVYVLLNFLDVQSHAVFATVLIFGSFSLTLIISMLSYKFIELPFIKLGKLVSIKVTKSPK